MEEKHQLRWNYIRIKERLRKLHNYKYNSLYLKRERNKKRGSLLMHCKYAVDLSEKELMIYVVDQK